MTKIIDQTSPPCQSVMPLDPFERRKEYTSYIEVRNGKDWRALGPRSAPLGTNTKSAAISAANTKASAARKALRRRGYKLLATARQIAPKKHRITTCMSHPGKDRMGKMVDSVDVVLVGEKAKFEKVAVCGSISACPICAPKLMAKKQQEVLIGCRNHRKNGGSTLMATFTNRHKRNNNLSEERKKLVKALSTMKADYQYKAIRKEYGMIGAIRSIEVTIGQNGWHLHVHEAWFIGGGHTVNQMKDLESRLFKIWYKHCKKHGLGLPSRAHGVRIDYRESEDPKDDAIGSYITKQAQELTGGMHKESKHGGVTYWGLLSELSEQWDLRKSRLAREYMGAMKGLAFIYWSQGLKAILNVEEDMSIAEEKRRSEEEPVRDNIKIPVSRWYPVVRAWKHARVLEMMEKRGGEATLRYVEVIYERDTYERKRLDKEKSDLRRSINESTVEAMKREGVERLQRVI